MPCIEAFFWRQPSPPYTVDRRFRAGLAPRLRGGQTAPVGLPRLARALEHAPRAGLSHGKHVAKLDSTFVLQAGLIAQDVAAQMRKMLGARGEDAPIADGKIAWYSVPSQIVVTARRDGSMRWRGRGFLGDSSATLLLANAFDSARASGDVAMIWPDGFAADSVVMTLGLRPEPVTQAITYTPGMSPIKFAAFYLAVPEESPALPVRDNDMPRYPDENERHRVAGQLVMQFVVDTAGKAIPSTIHNVWPEDAPRLTGDEKRYYDAFVSAVSAWNVRMSFTPARVGVCPVKQLVQLPIRFVGPRHS